MKYVKEFSQAVLGAVLFGGPMFLYFFLMKAWYADDFRHYSGSNLLLSVHHLADSNILVFHSVDTISTVGLKDIDSDQRLDRVCLFFCLPAC